nr:immunoglobulin heavy chain junction region [Homo sapiens]MBN4634092.1 immunoglobulin heavy chain junction region [Homo sapiens]
VSANEQPESRGHG